MALDPGTKQPDDLDEVAAASSSLPFEVAVLSPAVDPAVNPVALCPVDLDLLEVHVLHRRVSERDRRQPAGIERLDQCPRIRGLDRSLPELSADPFLEPVDVSMRAGHLLLI